MNICIHCPIVAPELISLEHSSQCSLISNGTDDGTRHLALVFFDVLLLNSESLLRAPYSRRRHILEALVSSVPGYAMLAERTAISMGADVSKTETEDAMRGAFATLIADHQEGTVLKADDGKYNDWRSPWVKVGRKCSELGVTTTLTRICHSAQEGLHPWPWRYP